MHKYTVSTSVQRVRHHLHQLSPAGSREPPQNNHRVHAAHGTIYPVMRLYPLDFLSCLYPPVKYLYSLSRLYTLPATHLYYRSCVCITGHASAFLVMRMYPHAKHLYPSVTRLCIPSCHCHTSVYP